MGSSQAEVSMGKGWLGTSFSVFRVLWKYTGKGKTRTARAVQTRPKEQEQKNMEARNGQSDRWKGTG